MARPLTIGGVPLKRSQLRAARKAGRKIRSQNPVPAGKAAPAPVLSRTRSRPAKN
jgi:hypothetical protein